MVTLQHITGAPPAKVNASLAEHLSNWRTVSDFMQMAGRDDIASLLVLELNGKNRAQIIERLSARYGRIEAERIRRIKP